MLGFVSISFCHYSKQRAGWFHKTNSSSSDKISFKWGKTIHLATVAWYKYLWSSLVSFVLIYPLQNHLLCNWVSKVHSPARRNSLVQMTNSGNGANKNYKSDKININGNSLSAGTVSCIILFHIQSISMREV